MRRRCSSPRCFRRRDRRAVRKRTGTQEREGAAYTKDSRRRSGEVGEEFRSGLNTGNQQPVARADAGDVEQIALSIVDFIEFRFIGDRSRLRNPPIRPLRRLTAAASFGHAQPTSCFLPSLVLLARVPLTSPAS
jgi:hypothetical protein